MGELRVDTIDYHTAGEPFRIVTGGVEPPAGRTVLDRRDFAAAHLEDVRRLLVHEPRGHADMYGCFVTPPDDDGADLGVVFFHNAGYSTACGHGTIALVTWALESGRLDAAALPREEGQARVSVDAPSGRLATWAAVDGDRVRSVRFRNVPSFCGPRREKVETSRGTVESDVAYGGAYYASVPASAVGYGVEPSQVARWIGVGREIKAELNARDVARHPAEDRLSGMYGVIFHEEVFRPEARVHQRNVTVFADREVDRSPCGSGTSARLALLHADGAIGVGEWMLHDSVIGTRFRARVVDTAEVHGMPAVVTEVEGSARRTGEHRFLLDADDELGTGFLLC